MLRKTTGKNLRKHTGFDFIKLTIGLYQYYRSTQKQPPEVLYKKRCS